MVGAFVVVFVPREGRAELAECVIAAEQAQVLRDAHKLTEARAALQVCVNSNCPTFIRRDCGQWLEEVDESLPTVVISATDASGKYVSDVRVLVDGTPFASRLDGRAQPINPGLHVFRFERSDGTSAMQQVLVRQGGKNQYIVVALAGVPWRTLGLVVGGIGVVGLGIGTAFGLAAASDKSRADCDERSLCEPSALASARRNATVANVGFVTGGVLVAAGVGLVLWASKGGFLREMRTSVRGTGLVMEGRW